jgi:hypothetical protein
LEAAKKDNALLRSRIEELTAVIGAREHLADELHDAKLTCDKLARVADNLAEILAALVPALPINPQSAIRNPRRLEA